jgi:hypothetical protein
MIFSSTACADYRLEKPFYGAIIGLFFAASGCSIVAPNIEEPAQLPAASVDPNSSLGSTASSLSLHPESEEEVQTNTTPIDRP